MIMGLLKKIKEKRPELWVIISSATLNKDTFSDYFRGENDDIGIIEIN